QRSGRGGGVGRAGQRGAGDAGAPGAPRRSAVGPTPGRGRIPRTSTPSVRGGGRPDARHAPRTGSGAARPTGQDGDVTHSQADQSTPRSGPIRVVLVDDQALVRGGFSMLIMASDDMEVVGEA